ncbi:MAG: ABC transporter ATP-binding protein, partial [Clostridiales Family XIII bacterium]|nr:ABC transporter ATP-binding protein [Clostridiales Family XIII bacterium]
AYTVLDFVLLGRAPHLGALRRPGRKDVDSGLAALDALGIPHLADKPYTEISGGERQQAQIARAVCQDPRIILFDEPTAHLDYGNQHRILLLAKRLAAQGFSAVITTHNPDHALLLGGRAAVLGQDGSLVCGEAAEMITEPRMRALYKTQMRIAFVPEAGRVCCLAPALQE